MIALAALALQLAAAADICVYKEEAKLAGTTPVRAQYDIMERMREKPESDVIVESLSEDLTPEFFAAGAKGMLAIAETVFPGRVLPIAPEKLSPLQRDFIVKEGGAKTLYYLGRRARLLKFDPSKCPGLEGCMAKLPGTGLDRMLQKRAAGYTFDRRDKDLLFIEEAWKNSYRVDFRKNGRPFTATVQFAGGKIESFTVRDKTGAVTAFCP